MRRYGWLVGFVVVYLATLDTDPATRMDLLFPFIVGAMRKPKEGVIPLLLWGAIGMHHPTSMITRLIMVPFALLRVDEIYTLHVVAVAMIYAASLYADPWRAFFVAVYVGFVIHAGNTQLQSIRFQTEPAPRPVTQKAAVERKGFFYGDHCHRSRTRSA